MIITAKAHAQHNDAPPAHAPSLDDIASLRLEMRASFYELSERLKLLELEQTTLLSKFDALLSLINDAIPQRR